MILFLESVLESVTTQMQAVVTIYYHCIIFLHLMAIVYVMANLLLK